MHATTFLEKLPSLDVPPVLLLVGEDHALGHAVVQAVARKVLGDDDPTALVELSGQEPSSSQPVAYSAVFDELCTRSMWATTKVVCVDNADKFVSKYRDKLEAYCRDPASSSVLILCVSSADKRTRLYKLVSEKEGLVECTELRGRRLVAWLQSITVRRYGKRLSEDAAHLLTELVGNQLGRLRQELDKLAAYVGDRGTIDAAAVRKLVGGWKVETVWHLLDAAGDGRLDQALTDLQKLLTAGGHPLQILGAVRYRCRRYVRAAELARQGGSLQDALRAAGVRDWELQQAERHLRRLGRTRVERLLEWLEEAEADLKGESRLPERLVLERLIFRLAGLGS